MKVEINYGQAFISIEAVIKSIMEAQENDGKIDINEGIQIALKALDEICSVFTDKDNKIGAIIESLKNMLNQLSKAISDGHMSRFEIIMLSMKLVQLITDIIKILD